MVSAVRSLASGNYTCHIMSLNLHCYVVYTLQRHNNDCMKIPYWIMLFKVLFDIIMSLKNLATYILKRHTLLTDIIYERHNVLNDINKSTRHNMLTRHNHLNDINLQIKVMRHNYVAQFHTT